MRPLLGFLSAFVLGTFSAATYAADGPAPTIPQGAAQADETDPLLEPPAPATRNIGNSREAVQMLLSRSTDLKSAIDDVRIAEAKWRGALALALPQLSINGIGTLNVINVRQGKELQLDRTEVGVTASASVPLVDIRAWYGIGTADRATQASTPGLVDIKRVQLTSVTSALVAIYTTERVAEIGRTSLHDALDRRALAKRRIELGAGTELDLLRTEQDVVTAKSTVVANNEALRRARDSLGLALGDNGPWGVLPSFTLDGALEYAKSQCHGISKLEDRPDLAAARTRVEVAERRQREAKQAFLPTLGARSDFGASTAGKDPHPRWNIQATLSFDIWDGGGRYAGLRETEARVDQAEQQYEALRRRESIEVLQLKRAIQVATDARKLAFEGTEIAIRSDKLTRDAFANGRGTSLELVTAATARRQAEINLALRDFELVRAQALASLALSRCDT